MIISHQSSSNLPRSLPLSVENRPQDLTSRQMKNNVMPIQIEKGDYNSSYADNYIKHEQGPASKVTRYDIINKNYIFPQDKYTAESNYTGSYKNTAQGQARAERVSHVENEVIPKGKFQGNSSYLDTYVNSQQAKREPFRPEGQLKFGGKFEGSSNYAQNYANKGLIERQEKVTFNDNKIIPEGKFEDSSTYAGNYVANPIQINQNIKREGELKVGGKFEGASSYASDYDERNRSQLKREKIQYKDNEIMPRGQFQGGSTYQSNYLSNEKFTPSKLMKHVEQLKVGGEFYGASNYALNYDNKGFDGRRQKAIIPQNKIFSQGKFDDFTTYTGNYIQNPLQKKEIYRPEGQLKVSGGIFNANSSYGNDYIKREGDGRQKTISYPANNIIPKGNFTGNSTYGDNYVPSAIERREQFHPESNLKTGGKFQGNSNYTQNYDGLQAAPRYLNRQNQYQANQKQK